MRLSRRSFFLPKHRRLLAVLILTTLTLTTWFFRPASPLYTITDLNTPPGDPNVAASAINNSGQIVGASHNRLSTFRWKAAAFTQLPQPPNGYSSGSAINDKGEITGAFGAAGRADHALLFSAGRLRDLGTLPGYVGSFGRGINGRGQIVGALYTSRTQVGGPSLRAFLYSSGRMVALPLLRGRADSLAHGINASGQVVGGCTQGFSASQAFLYDSSTGKMTAPPMPPGYTGGYAHGINDSGQVIGEIDGAQPGGHAALWQGGSVKDLGTLPGTDMSMGLAINNRGQAVGSSDAFSDTGLSGIRRYLSRFRAFSGLAGRGSRQSAWVYRDGKMADLNALIPLRSGWELEEAHGINDRGQIVGRGLHHGQERAFLLTPVR